MVTVVQGVITHEKIQLNKECMNEITARQEEQEALNENLGKKILLMQRAGTETEQNLEHVTT